MFVPILKTAELHSVNFIVCEPHPNAAVIQKNYLLIKQKRKEDMREIWERVDRSVPKTDFGGDCTIVYIYKNISNYRLKRSELIYITYINKVLQEGGKTGNRLDLAHKPWCADPSSK